MMMSDLDVGKNYEQLRKLMETCDLSKITLENISSYA